MRTIFSLPNPRTIRKWLENVQCQPGFLTDVFDTIQSKESCKLYSLVVDSMAIRKRLIVDPIHGVVKGYTDIGGDCIDESKQATEALVFLLVPLTSRTRYPVGFFFVNKVDANLQSALIRQCLQVAAERSIEVVNITCDGCSSNVSTLHKLGAALPVTPWFNHPYTEQVVSTVPPYLVYIKPEPACA